MLKIFNLLGVGVAIASPLLANAPGHPGDQPALSATGTQFVIWLGCAYIAILFIRGLVDFYRTVIREQPPPSETYATKVELSRTVEKFEETVRDLDRRMNERHDAATRSRKEMHNKIEDLANQLTAVKTLADILEKQDALARLVHRKQP